MFVLICTIRTFLCTGWPQSTRMGSADRDDGSFARGGKAGPDLTADWPEIARHATIGLRLTRFQRYPTAAVKRRQSRGQTLACCNGLRAIYRVFDQSMELGLVASRRRAHPVRRSWAAGHRLRAMRRTWARWRDEARGAACRRQKARPQSRPPGHAGAPPAALSAPSAHHTTTRAYPH